MTRFILSCLITFSLLSACYAAKRPQWTKSEPADREYWYGISSIPKSTPNFREVARETALKNISLQINVQISAELQTSETEISGLNQSRFISTIQSSTTAMLDDVQLYQSFEDKKHFWACYRVNKAQYRAMREMRKRVALEQALDLLGKYDAKTDGLSLRISYLLDGLSLLESFVDLDLRTIYRKEEIHLYNELMSRLKGLPGKLSVAVSPDQTELVIKRGYRSTYRIFVSETGDEPCAAVPMKAFFSRGEGEISADKLTGEKGDIRLYIDRITSDEALQSVTIGLDKDYFNDQIKSEALRELFSRLSFPEATLTIHALKPRVFLKYHDGTATGEEGIKKINGRLLELDLGLTDSEEKAHYVLAVDISTQDGIYIPEVMSHTSYAITRISLKDAGSGTTLYSDSFDTIKGAGKTKEIARQKALQAAIGNICDELLYYNVYKKIYP